MAVNRAIQYSAILQAPTSRPWLSGQPPASLDCSTPSLTLLTRTLQSAHNTQPAIPSHLTESYSTGELQFCVDIHSCEREIFYFQTTLLQHLTFSL